MPNAPDTPIAYHGGNLTAARHLFPNAPEPWIDLSTGINPEPYPVPALAADCWSRLPEPSARERLESVAAACYRAAGDADVVSAPGTQALIQLLPRLHDRHRVGILGFTYGEYERVWRGAGCVPATVAGLDALADYEIAVIVNPNNPDGRLVEPARLLDLAGTLAARGGLLVVDEAFMDMLPPGHSLIPRLPEAGVLVLRSFGKAYGLAGVRLGFAVTNRRLGGALRDALGPWAVSGPAIEIGRRALADAPWLQDAERKLSRQAATIDDAFLRCGATLIGGTPLFRLFAHRDAPRLFAHFGRHGILLRHFPARPEWLRVGLFADPAAARRLAEAVADLVLP
jgi:cobalamin biosynthetic protein CobC